ncbi:MAG: ion channel [Bradyrhizobium sp.]|jgi:inward rectifier potassium channel|uniref:ion channel n=1 Tax=Bradyrhizobium sp. TaxID=376 RepID=UPI003C70A5F4
MLEKLKERLSRSRVIAFGDREIITEGLDLSFWADISHRCMTASWPSFIAGVVLVFIVFNAAFGLLYWLGDQPVSNVARNDYLDYLYFSIETLSTAGYGDMHPQTHYGHFVSAVELLTGIFSMSVMTGLIFSRFSRPHARLLFANNPVIATQDGKPTLMLRLANERHNIIGNATARLWLLKNTITNEGRAIRRFNELPLLKNEHPALALSWTLYHVLDEQSLLFNLDTEDLKAASVSLVVVVSGYDVVAAQTIHARKSYDHTDIRFGQRYADILENLEDGRIRIDYGKFHDTLDE